MVVSQFSLALRRHASLGLLHLVGIIVAWLIPLVGIVALNVRSRMRPRRIEFHGVMPWRHAHTWVCNPVSKIYESNADMPTEFRVGSRRRSHGKRFAATRYEKLPTFVEIVKGSFDLCCR